MTMILHHEYLRSYRRFAEGQHVEVRQADGTIRPATVVLVFYNGRLLVRYGERGGEAVNASQVRERVASLSRVHDAEPAA